MTTLTQQFILDPKVQDLDKALKTPVCTPEQKKARVILPSLSVGIVLSMAATFISAPADPPFVKNLVGIIGIVLVVAVGAACLFVYPRIGTPATIKANRERKASRRSIKRSVKAARVLGDAVPVLTESHIQAGMRFDEAIADRADEWVQEDIRIVRNLLLSDLGRSAAIISLVGDRGVTTAEDVFAAISEMESNTKPLQDGWL